MIFLTIVITILPNYKVKAMTLIDNSYLPPLVQDDYTDYIIYKTKNSEIYMIKFNYSDNLVFYTSSSNSNGNFYIECKRLDDSEVNIYYNKYFFDRRYEDINDWNWLKSTSFIDTQYLRAPIGGNKYDSSVKEIQSILYSTVDMYYNPSETSTTIYSSDSNLIPGEHKHDSSLSFNEKKLEDKTYSKDNGNYEKDIIVSTIDLYQDNVSSVQTIFNFSDYYDNNYKYYIKPQGKETIDVTNEVLNGTSINGKGYVSLTFEKSTKLVAQVLRNQSDLGINKVFDVKVKTVSNKFESNDGESYPDKPNDGYLDYIVFKTKDNSVFMITFNKTKNYSFFTSDTNDSGGFYIVSYLNKGGENYNEHNFYKLDNGTWKVSYQNQYFYGKVFGGSKYDSSVKDIKSILYSTVDMYYLYDRTSTGNYSSDSYMIQGLHQNNMSLPLDYRRFNDKTYNKNQALKERLIKFIDGIANDLDNRNVNLLKVDFNDIYNSNYKYQISFDNKNWIDVTDTIIANDNHYIIYSLMANTTIYAKVLSQDNEEIDTNNKTIEDLNDYQLIKSVSSTDTLNIYSIDFRLKNIQNIMGYEHYTTKIKLQYGSNDHTNKNRPYYLDYSITGLDENGMELNEDLTDYYNVQINDNEYYLGDYESFLYYDLVQIKPLLPNKVKQLKVSFYFSNLDNYYIHYYTTNTKSQTEIRFTESLFKDYVLYQFPSGFDYALIRPKSFQTSNGSLIADAYYFNSGILEMTTFDFKNNDISTIFDTTMDKSDYLIEGNNVKFNFTSDEDNNVYPALYLRKEVFCNIEIGYNDVLFAAGMRSYFCVNEKKRIPSATFYVHKDFYIEFINKNTLETKVVNIDKGDFEDKNNLELTQDFKDKVNEKYPEEEASSLGDIGNFINNLKESFLGKFKFIGQLKEIYDIFNTNISEDTEPPNWTINVEFKPLGIKYENLKVIDFSFFEEYKELLFNFEKLFLSTFTIVGIVRNIKKGSD